MPFAIDLSQSTPTRVEIVTIGNGPSGSKRESFEMAHLGVRVAVDPDSPFAKSGQIEIFKIADNENVAVFNGSTGSVDYSGFSGDIDACFEAVKALLGRHKKQYGMGELLTPGTATDTFDARGLDVTAWFTIKNCDVNVVMVWQVSIDGSTYFDILNTVYTDNGAYSMTAPDYAYVRLKFASQSAPEPTGTAIVDNIIFSAR